VKKMPHRCDEQETTEIEKWITDVAFLEVFSGWAPARQLSLKVKRTRECRCRL
jgi:hypothetical protein